MPGKHISDEQRRDLMDHLADGNSVEVAASKSGLSRASGYNIVKEVKSGGKKPRARTRPDPLEGIFDSQAAPILKALCLLALAFIFVPSKLTVPIFTIPTSLAITSISTNIPSSSFMKRLRKLFMLS